MLLGGLPLRGPALSRSCWRKMKASSGYGATLPRRIHSKGQPEKQRVATSRYGNGRDVIPRHKHLGQDEIVFLQTGTLHARLGGQERDLHAGGMAFIPAYTWVSFKNTSAEPASIVFIFSEPGFENHLRCVSVLANEKTTPHDSRGTETVRSRRARCLPGSERQF